MCVCVYIKLEYLFFYIFLRNSCFVFCITYFYNDYTVNYVIRNYIEKNI